MTARSKDVSEPADQTRRTSGHEMGGADKRSMLIRAARRVIRREAARTTDEFTAGYLNSRAQDLEVSLSALVEKKHLLSAKNIISRLAEAVDALTKYDVAADQLYKAAVEDLRDELEAASEGRDDYW